MDEVANLKERELDALKEVVSIGAGHAATALSQLTGRRIMIDVPSVHVTSLQDAPAALGEPNRVVAAVLMRFLGDLTGRTVLLFDRDAALHLSELLLNRPGGQTQAFGEMEQSAIKETANILTGACMNALSDFLGLMILPSVPGLAVDLCSTVLSSAYLDYEHDGVYVVSVDTRFHFTDSGATLIGHFVVLPDAGSLSTILKAIRAS